MAAGAPLWLLAAPSVAAGIRVEPTPEHRAHCAQVADGKCNLVYSIRGLTLPGKAEEPGVFTKTARMGIFKPVDWHVKVSYRGNAAGVLFAYDARAAHDSRERVFKFFARHLEAQ